MTLHENHILTTERSNMIKAAIFDLDGTLLNTLDTITYYTNKTLQKYGISTVSVDDVKYFIGEGSRKLIERALISRGAYNTEKFEEIHADYKNSYDKEPLYLTDVYPGVREALATLSSEGIKLAVLSNKPHSATLSVVKSFFGDSFDTVYGAREGIPLKPDPTSLKSLISEMGFESHEIAYFGDTATDMKTGRAAKAAVTVGVLWGFRTEEELRLAEADTIISSADMIPEIIKKPY